MSAEAYREDEMYREAEPDIINIKRNPYLVDYEKERRLRGYGGQRMRGGSQRVQGAPQKVQGDAWEQEADRAPRRSPRQGQGQGRVPQRRPQQSQELGRVPQGRYQQSQELGRVPQGRYQQGQELGRAPQGRYQQGQELGRVPQGRYQQDQELGRMSQRRYQQGQELGRTPQRRPQQGQELGRAPQRKYQQGQELGRASQGRYQQGQEVGGAPRRRIQQTQEMRMTRAEIERKRAAARRRSIVRMQRMVLFVGVFCITLLCGLLYMKRIDAKEGEQDNKESKTNETNIVLPETPASGMVQGLTAAEFAKHPEWEENFLTPNEYSRPGEALEEINSIFVHYTANPNTSAAQNRSYFEQLKDTHITSASAHFIIGYNGEIIQCIPLDEIAYAVQTRNYDSVSIECCYKSTDGSFTQETYDSLVELLAWLTDAYDLTTDDILRHYDCGGKKCPIYYTEHEDAWERLKEDVGEKL